MSANALANVNGIITPLEEARVSVLDRGYLFGDAVYEVIRVYGGRPFEMNAHMDRLERSCDGLGFENVPPMDDLATRGRALIHSSGLLEAVLYYQISRGTGVSRAHEPSASMHPSIVVTIESVEPPSEALRTQGASAITVPESRWDRADLKTVNLLPRILVRQQANKQGAYEAIWVDAEERILEASASNVFVVIDGTVLTPPLGNRLLAGVTRAVVLELAENLGINTEERWFSLDELRNADEVFLTGSTTEVLALVKLDDIPMGGGAPGPVTLRLAKAFAEKTTA